MTKLLFLIIASTLTITAWENPYESVVVNQSVNNSRFQERFSLIYFLYCARHMYRNYHGIKGIKCDWLKCEKLIILKVSEDATGKQGCVTEILDIGDISRHKLVEILQFIADGNYCYRPELIFQNPRNPKGPVLSVGSHECLDQEDVRIGNIIPVTHREETSTLPTEAEEITAQKCIEKILKEAKLEANSHFFAWLRGIQFGSANW